MSCESTSLAPSKNAGDVLVQQQQQQENNSVNNCKGICNSNNKRATRTKSYSYVSVRDRIPARLVLYFLSWSGFLVSFMMRNDINFALVAMVDGRNNTADKIQKIFNLCVNNNTNYNETNGNIDEFSSAALQAVIENRTIIASNENQNFDDDSKCRDAYVASMSKLTAITVYDWSSTVKSIIITSFYVWYVLSQVVGGIATQYFGTKRVFGWSQFATAAASLCIPLCSDLHYSIVILLRSMQGFASGLTWPAMYAIVGHWIPLLERSRFMSSFQGFSIGIGLTYLLCGFIIDNFGWRYVFYTTGTLGMCWCISWYLLAYDTPQKHPRITANELSYIELHVSTDMTVVAHNVRVPWYSIFCSAPAWAIAITTFGRIWVHYVFIVNGPIFMKHILKLDYQENGFLSGMPFICSYFSSVIFCYVADKLTKARILHLTNVRKLFTALSQVVPGLLLLRMCYIELDVVHVLIIWFIAVTFVTASYAGAMANIVDIAPNFAGPVLAFCQTIHMSASFLSPFVAGQIITAESEIDQWHTVFILSTIVTILTYLVYQVYGTSKIQKWNYPTTPNQISADAANNCLNNSINVNNDIQSDVGNNDDAAANNTAINIISNNITTVAGICDNSDEILDTKKQMTNSNDDDLDEDDNATVDNNTDLLLDNNKFDKKQ